MASMLSKVWDDEEADDDEDDEDENSLVSESDDMFSWRSVLMRSVG